MSDARKPIPNPATQLYSSELNEPPSDSTEDFRPHRSILWKIRAALGLLPKKKSTDRDLRMAIRGVEKDEVMRLLEEGITPAAYPDSPWLCLAARRGSTSMLELLLIYGAQVDQVDRETRGAQGRSALHEAAKRGWVRGARLLLEAEADAGLEDDRGMTPLWLAVRRGHPDMVLLLLEAGARLTGNSGRALPLLHEATTPSVVNTLVHAGAALNALDDRGFSALFQQVKAGRADVLERLLFHGADFKQRDRQGRTAAFWLGKGDANECLAVLSKAGLDFEAVDMEGNTAAHVAPIRSRDESFLANLYRQAPDAWDVKNKQGETALFVLARCGMQDLANKLEADLKSRRQALQTLAEQSMPGMGLLNSSTVR